MALVSNTFRRIGGTETYLYALTRALTEAGHEVVRLGEDFDADDHDGEQVAIPRFEYLADTGRVFSALAQALERIAPAVIHVHNVYNPRLERRLFDRFPRAIRTLHSFYPTCPRTGRWLPRERRNCLDADGWTCLANGCLLPWRVREFVKGALHLALTRETHRRTRRVLVASRFVRDLLGRVGFSTERVEVLPYFHEPAPEPELARPERRILFAGLLWVEKGIGPFLDVLARLPGDVHASVVGDGPARSEAEAYARTLGVSGRVTFHGWRSGTALLAEYDRAAVTLFTSLWMEPFGLIGPEAMARSRPTVGFDVGGVGEWLEDGVTGWLVPAGDVEAMAARTRDLLEHPERAAAFGEAGRRRAAERFSRAAHMERLLAIYAETAAS